MALVLAGTVERHARNIRVKNLHKVRWTPSLAQRIDDAMRAVSAFAHDEPLVQHTAQPRPEKLAGLLADYEAMCDELKSTKKSAAEGGEQSPSAEIVEVSAKSWLAADGPALQPTARQAVREIL